MAFFVSKSTQSQGNISPPDVSETAGADSGKEIRSAIRIRRVRVHNLKSIDLDIPHGQWLTVCGRSGSGKTSLAFDTLFVEGQRRYAQSFSPYIRQYLNLTARPDAEILDGIPPAIALRGEPYHLNRKMTVGTVTECIDFLRLYFVNMASIECPTCQTKVQAWNPQHVVNWIQQLPNRPRFQVGFERSIDPNDSSAFPTLTEDLRRAGYARAIYQGKSIHFADTDPPSDRISSATLTVIVDRLVARDDMTSRLLESLEVSFREGRGCIVLLLDQESDLGVAELVDGLPWYRINFGNVHTCSRCACEFAEPTPQLFDFNHKLGQCETCLGQGIVRLEIQHTDNSEDEIRNDHEPCPSCGGKRMNEIARAFRINDFDLGDLCELSIGELLNWTESQLVACDPNDLRDALVRVKQRLVFLRNVGLEYLTLGRTACSLSHGESRRLSLASVLGTSLINMLYVLDEPSIGLHPHEVVRLKDVIAHLHRRGNTVVVVDHEPELIMASERVVEIGPGQGAESGSIVFDGSPQELLIDEKSLTGQYLSGRRCWYGGEKEMRRRQTDQGHIQVRQAALNNLKNIDVDIPLGLLCAVTGVSGAGKSSLVRETIYRGLARQFGDLSERPRPANVTCTSHGLRQVILVDQSLPAKTSRSNLITYTNSFNEIRRLFSDTADGKSRKLKPRHFSFNVEGGRCDKCKGDGFLRIDMHFLAEMHLRCDHCQGRRFKSEILKIKYRGHSIADILDLTVKQAFVFFRGQPKIQARLKFLADVGLDYLTLGRTLSTLSTGERQRLKLAHFLSSTARGRSLLILDEPTVGLHMADITILLDCFSALLAVGHSILIVEHNLQLLQHVDHIVDLGPGAGHLGGQVVAQGTPEEIVNHPDSITGQWLKRFMAS